MKQALGAALAPQLLSRYHRLATERSYAPDAQQIADRCLRNVCLGYLVGADPGNVELAQQQYRDAGNMTDRLAALREIADHGNADQRHNALQGFYLDWQHETLVVNQWLQVQATIPDAEALSRVQALMSHEAFDLRNPNKARSLVGAFANQNPINFHRLDGAGYRFLADIVITLNTRNPQLAARLLTPLTKWRSYLGREDLMRTELERLKAQPDLSADVFEVVMKSLQPV